jgi:hypothetical protein
MQDKQTSRPDVQPLCYLCGDPYNPLRAALDYLTCKPCGELRAQSVKHCIAPLNKSNYFYIHDPKLLHQLNPKRT